MYTKGRRGEWWLTPNGGNCRSHQSFLFDTKQRTNWRNDAILQPQNELKMCWCSQTGKHERLYLGFFTHVEVNFGSKADFLNANTDTNTDTNTATNKRTAVHESILFLNCGNNNEADFLNETSSSFNARIQTSAEWGDSGPCTNLVFTNTIELPTQIQLLYQHKYKEKQILLNGE